MNEQGYSKQEIDLKFNNLENKIDNLPTNLENIILKNNEDLRLKMQSSTLWTIGIGLTIIGLVVSLLKLL